LHRRLQPPNKWHKPHILSQFFNTARPRLSRYVSGRDRPPPTGSNDSLAVNLGAYTPPFEWNPLHCIYRTSTINTSRERILEFSISSTTGVPIYRQLTDQICAAIARGRLQPNEKLPSVRELSQTLVVNPNTVARAYTELERERTLYTRPGLGVFVSQRHSPLSEAERRDRLLKAVDQFLIDAIRLGCDAQEVTRLVDERIGQFQWHTRDVPV
jgi:GntR family transcriptional regulator